MTVDATKYDEAMLLVDLGRSNTEIIETLTEKYGSGVSTNKLADWRRTSPERMLTRKERIAREVFESGGSNYEAQKRIKEELEANANYDWLNRVRDRMEGIGLVEEVKLPPEMLTDEAKTPNEPALQLENHALEPEEVPTVEPAISLEVAPPPQDKAVSALRDLRQWLRDINAKSFSMTPDGEVSVTVEHTFNIGGLA